MHLKYVILIFCLVGVKFIVYIFPVLLKSELTKILIHLVLILIYLVFVCMMPFGLWAALPAYIIIIISYHNIPCYISYHIISYHIISYHIISYHIISYIISYHIISYHISYHIISYHIISYIISYHIISYHIISYHIISYHIIQNASALLQ